MFIDNIQNNSLFFSDYWIFGGFLLWVPTFQHTRTLFFKEKHLLSKQLLYYILITKEKQIRNQVENYHCALCYIAFLIYYSPEFSRRSVNYCCLAFTYSKMFQVSKEIFRYLRSIFESKILFFNAQ